MALDELHARRLATVASIFESALDRMELVLKSLESRIRRRALDRSRPSILVWRGKRCERFGLACRRL